MDSWIVGRDFNNLETLEDQQVHCMDRADKVGVLPLLLEITDIKQAEAYELDL